MKKGDLRRGQILDTAEKLFFEQGYDRTSVQDILNVLNISKGGFYHYFDAKETVLRELCERRWSDRYDRVKLELYGTRRSPIDKLNLILSFANLFEGEDSHFAALMLKICYRDGDAAIRDYRRRTLVDMLRPHLDEVISEGIEAGLMHSRQPMQVGRLLLLLACDINDEVCDMFVREPENPDRMIRMVELLNAYRESVERLSGAPYGSVTLFDAARMVNAWRTATEELNALEASGV